MTASDRSIAIVGSGIVGSIMAYLLTRHGRSVTVFEKGGEDPYPHSPQFREQVWYGAPAPAAGLAPDLSALTQSGNYPYDVSKERHLIVGGSAARWGAITDRMHPNDFVAGSRYASGIDWPFGYGELEPYYGKAEELLGVSGSDDGDPFAAPRSGPYPLPAFELTYDIRVLAERMRSAGIFLRTSPQARTREAHDGRPACENHGTCHVCPIGARYSPQHHLKRAIESGRCELRTHTAVRRLVRDRGGRLRALVYRQDAGARDEEHSADVFVVAAGAVESSRLLLLSRDARARDGIGNDGGHVGRHLMFHHIWDGHMHYDEDLFAGRVGPEMGQSRQFLDPPSRGRHGGVLVQMRSGASHFLHGELRQDFESAADLLAAMQGLPRCESIVFHCESSPDAEKRVTLSETNDRFGDPFAHVHYQTSGRDSETYRYARELLVRFATASHASSCSIVPETVFNSAAHHMGTCRMGHTERDGVVDAAGKVHGTPNLYVVGGSNLPSSSAVHPTLTMVALAVRAAEHIATL